MSASSKSYMMACMSKARLPTRYHSAIVRAWSDMDTDPLVVCEAWERLALATDWEQAHLMASSCGLSPEEASLLADGVAVSQSANQRREAWVVNVADTVKSVGGVSGRVAGEWLVDADVVVNPALGERIAAEAAAAALAAMPPRQRLWETHRLLGALYGAIRPNVGLVHRCAHLTRRFEHRGRVYLLPSTQCGRSATWRAVAEGHQPKMFSLVLSRWLLLP